MAPKQDQQALTFVVTTKPDDANSAANKRRVRSVAAIQSWPGRRKRTFDQYEEDTIPDVAGAPDHGRSREKSKPKAEPGLHEAKPSTAVPNSAMQRPGLLTMYSGESQASSSSTQTSESTATACFRTSTSDIPCRCWRCGPDIHSNAHSTQSVTPKETGETANEDRRVGILLTPPESPSLAPPPSNMADPFNCYPVPYMHLYDEVLHHMLTVFGPRGWPALKITRQEGRHWEWFMTQHALSEPALFNVRLLFASGDMIKLGVLRREVSFWLQDKAIKSINEALADPKRAISDPLILAVGRIALHESIYGDRQAANTIHRPAQRRMIAMRGGMNALDLPPLVTRLMRWSDSMMAIKGGTPRFLEDDAANKNFTLEQSVTLSENWFPWESKAWRRRIRPLAAKPPKKT